MATGNVTVTTAAVYIQQAWTKDVQKPFYKALQASKLVTQRGELVADGGNTINVPFLQTLNARAKAAGTAVTYDNNTETQVQISINKQYYSAVLIDDIAKVQSNYNLQELYRGAQAEAVARQMDADITGLYGSAATSVSAGANVTDANIITIVQTLDANNVPRTNRYGLIGAYTHGDLLNINKYVAYDQTGNKGVAVTDGLVSNVYGFDLYMTNNLSTVVGTPNVGHSLFFHKSAISMAVQKSPTYKMEDSVDYIGMKTVLHAIYGVAVERSTAMVDLQRNVNP